MISKIWQGLVRSLFLVMLITVNVNAQETNEDSDVTEADDVSVEKGLEDGLDKIEPKLKPEPEQPQVNPDASFTPTEEISEDKPVAFPVDI